MIPVKNEDIARIAAISIGIARARLLKNSSPPLCPEATSEKNTIKNKRDTIINQIDQLPNVVFG